MDGKPYYCPKCRANRVKFKLIRRTAQEVKKDAANGEIISMGQEVPFITVQGDLEVECLVCNFVGYEMMFIKAAEREPRYQTEFQGRV